MIYDNIKAYAKRQKKSIRELERVAGLTNGTIGKWNEVSPRVDNLHAVACELGVTVDALLKTK